MKPKRATVLLALATTAIVVMLGSAHAATSTSLYQATASPAQVVAGIETPVVLTLTNSTQSSQSLGSANFNPPSGWTITAPALGGSVSSTSSLGKSWSIGNVLNQAQFRANSSGDALAPGDSVSATVKVVASCSATGTAWTTAAKQSNTFNGAGNDFYPQGGDQSPAGTTTVGTLAHFVFDAIGTQTVNSPFTVKITAKDGSGKTLPCYGGPATLTGLSGSPTYGSFGWSGGTGSASVTAAVSETTRLTATAGTVSDTSNYFAILALTCTSATLLQDCHSSDTSGMTNVNGSPPAGSATLGLGFTPPGSGNTPSFTCGTASSALAGSSLVQVIPTGYDPITGLVTVTLAYDKSIAPGTGVANFNVCILKNNVWSQPLNACSKSAPPCIAGRNRTGVGDLVIVVTLPGTDPLIGTG